MADLRPYRAKRRFDRTAEPSGDEATPSGSRIFMVHKHHAGRLHYDLRLEMGGALKSWAVPEGPSIDPKIRRLAVLVEDHPLAYANFEGRIPDGEYGAGATLIWDKGEWVSAEDVDAALAAGAFKFRLFGEKLRGGFMLKRLPDSPKNWLLIKERDDAARPAPYDILSAEPRSVASGLLIEDLEAKAPARKSKRMLPARLAGAAKAPLPKLVPPQLATLSLTVPAGDEWVFEIKHDGYRTLCRRDGDDIRLITRNGHDWTARYGALAKAFLTLNCKSALIDGEVVVQDARGASSIGLLERALSEGCDHEFTFFAFDLLYLDGCDLMGAKLSERKALLQELITPAVNARSPLQFSDHIEGAGAELFARACRLGLEGIVAKKRDAKYVPGRTTTWVKVKRQDVAQFAIIGFTANPPKHVAALMLAETAPALRYVGKVGSGISETQGLDLFKAFSAHAVEEPATEIPRGVTGTWIDPSRFTAEVAFRGITADGMLRQAALVGVSAQPTESLKPKLVTDSDLAAIRVTSASREMFEGSGATKLDIALYYARVADWMLPEIMGRPISLIRCTTGRAEDCFFQRHAFAGLPDGVSTILLSEEKGRNAYVVINTPRGFLGLSQFGVVEFHPWACRSGEPEKPDRIIIDLDPAPGVAWDRVIGGAEAVRARLNALGLAAFVRTTGGKGLHVVTPLTRRHTWDVVKNFSMALAKALAKDAPRDFTASPVKAHRAGKIYVDYARNYRGSTAVASYSLRARTALTIATPITWEELSGIRDQAVFDRKAVLQRLASLRADPWGDLDAAAAVITAKAQRDVGAT